MSRSPSSPSRILDGLLPIIALLVIALLIAVRPARAQGTREVQTGREVVGIPALNFDADEGIGYGAILQLFDYGDGTARPYRYTLQPTAFATSKGRRDLTIFADAPDLLPGGWRATATVGREHHRATPYYGVGNDTPRDPAREGGDEPTYFYRFERRQTRGTIDLQHGVAALPVRLLIGAGVSSVRVGARPFDAATTLLDQELNGRDAPDGRTAWVRGGFVLDTRDRETGPTRGRWAELLVQRADDVLGGTTDFTRVTATWREYRPLHDRVIAATRLVMQQIEGEAPFYELSTMQSSFKPGEALGGASSVRGLPKNRYVGKGLALYNAELRWRAADFTLRRKPAHVVLSGFADAGRVWTDRIRLSELASGLHAGYGAGARLGLGSSFVVAFDVGHSSESAAPIYLGLGYAF